MPPTGSIIVLTAARHRGRVQCCFKEDYQPPPIRQLFRQRPNRQYSPLLQRQLQPPSSRLELETLNGLTSKGKELQSGLACLDAPERDQPRSKASADRSRQWVPSSQVV
ncbi:MAG TPA: hypothetical protein V6C84_30240 [Coleofasciculaceae cyanobacterium]